MRIILFVLICVALTFQPNALFAASLPEKAYCTPEEKTAYIPIEQRITTTLPLFKLLHCKYKPSYLLGTIHSDNPNIIQQATRILDILKNSDAAYFEAIVDNKTQQELMRVILTPTPMLQKTIGDALYAQVKELSAQYAPNIPEYMLARYTPWSAAIMLQVPTAQFDNVTLDEYLQKTAKRFFVPIFGLESIETQFASFLSLNKQENIAFLQDTMAHIEDIRAQDKNIEDLYQAQDLPAIMRIREDIYQEIANDALRQKMVSGILDDRNNHFFTTIQPHLVKGKQFIAVGILHLFGETGLLQQLEKAGYFIFPAFPQ